MKLYQKKRSNKVMLGGIVSVMVLVLVLMALALLGSGTSQPANRITGPLDGTWETTGTTMFHMRTNWPG